MKKLVVVLVALLPTSLYAQNVIETRPAHNEGKLISQQEANSKALYIKEASEPDEFCEAPKNDFTSFPENQSLYIKDFEGNVRCIAESEDSQISYGTSVSRNEFGIDGGAFWSPSRKKLAFYRKDESYVTEFPLLDIKTRTGKLKSIKYPMNGMPSEKIGLGVYDRISGKTVYIDVTDFDEERYLAGVTWSPDDKYIFIQVEARSQHDMHLNMYRADNGKYVRTILTESNEKWVEPQDSLNFIKGSYNFIYRTDNRDGYKNLYLCDTLGNIRRLTNTDADIEYVTNDGRYVYYTSAEVSPVENHFFRIDIKNKKAKPQRLTSEPGWHKIKVSPDLSCYTDSYSSFNNPGGTSLHTMDGKKIRDLLTNSDPLEYYATGKVEFGTVKSADGKYDNYYRLFYPVNFNPEKKYPLIVYVYGGPHSQMVRNSWLGEIRMWEMLMSERGYFVYVQDNRGTMNRGAEYEKAINGMCGQVEMEDQMVGINWLKDLPYIDENRIGVHGWSYGGFMTITMATTHPDIFKVAVAGGPVIDWKWYEVMYGERYMDTPETNPEGFAKTELVGKAKRLKSKLLICQGAIDNTVVWQNSLSFIQECISRNIPVDYFPYPCAEHNMRGIERVHLYQKITDYFDDNL